MRAICKKITTEIYLNLQVIREKAHDVFTSQPWNVYAVAITYVAVGIVLALWLGR